MRPCAPTRSAREPRAAIGRGSSPCSSGSDAAEHSAGRAALPGALGERARAGSRSLHWSEWARSVYTRMYMCRWGHRAGFPRILAAHDGCRVSTAGDGWEAAGWGGFG